MKKHIYTVGTFALALSMSVLPALSLAKEAESGGGQSGKTVQVQATVSSQGQSSDDATSSSGGSGDDATSSSRGSDDNATSSNRGPGNENEATSSNRGPGNANEDRLGEDNEATSSDRDIERLGQDLNEHGPFHLELEHATSSAHSLRELQEKIADRRHELDDEEASTTLEDRDIIANANLARLAVLSFLASENLLGASGAQIAEHAREFNASISTTTNAEAEIHNRGFFSRLFFGGDSAAASVIASIVADNQQHLDNLTVLLNAANVAPDVKATLMAQITVLEDEQARLTLLAQTEQREWGLFSWRF
jgi:hypothetical protein